MPGVNWDVFAGLPGAAETNFEMLCRGLIRRHYGHCGDFRARAAQPGVEFHLKLHTACAQLGEPGRWWGWQCRWYGLGPGIPLGSTRRAKIKRAIATTLAEVGVLTDWVLWTRHPLTAGDQDWFYGLDAGGMRLHLWTVAEADDLLSGPAEILRETYFGELVLRAEDLVDLHERSIAPIRARWLPEAHQVVDAERTVRRTLAGRQTRHDLRTIADQLAKAENQLAQAAADQPDPISEQIKRLQALCAATVHHMAAVNTALQHGHLETVRDQIGQTPVLNAEDHAALRALRNTRQPCAPAATNATADVRLTGRLLSDLRERLDAHAVAVVAGAGCGKTQLAAQLTASEADRPAGILLHGRELNAGASLDDLARRFTIRARPCPSMEAMIEAVDAAGQRAGRRLPIVIDALNEAEDPRDWKPLLASLSVMLEDCPYVVFICTVRPEFKDECLPDSFPQVEIPSFGADTLDAVRRYFAYYKIDASDAVLPVGILRHPLSLRLFCEVTNPRREKVVGVEAIPASLTAVFDRYLEQVAERISTLSPRHCRVYPPEISDALEKIGVAMWEHRTRSIEFGELRDLLGDHGAWDCSIVRALEHEGVLLRQPGQTPGTHVMAASYDALAGHLIASAVLARRDRNGARDWIQDSATVEALTAEPPTRHPLASDVLAALAALLPRRQQRQLWPIIDPQLRRQALREAAGLEAQLLDAATIDELAKLARQTTPGLPDMFWRLWETRAAPAHPLNAGFLDTVLRPMNVADRDLRWTEWVRSNQREILADLHDLERRWRASSDRHDSDALLARWVTWLLTSTVRRLRDQATCCLYWYGRGSPAALFTLTLDKVGINDPYVTERLLAASYGVTMAHQVRGEILAAALPAYLTGLRDTFAGDAAARPTSHWLTRLYIQGTAALACAYYPETIPEGLISEGRVPFAAGPAIDPIPQTDPRAAECNQTLHMDFENYTLGRLVEDRQNYDMEHPGHQQVVAHVRGTVWELGWRKETFGPIDDEIERAGRPWLSDSTERSTATERYGKKYGWVGYYTAAGQLDDRGELTPRSERLADVDIDPSFPDPPEPAPVQLPDWARPTPADTKRWIRQGIVKVPDDLLYRAGAPPDPHRWAAVYGYLEAANQAPGRRVWGFLTAVLVADQDADRLETALRQRSYPGRRLLPEPPEDHYTFAGEIPWHPHFAHHDEYDEPFYSGQVHVDGEPPIDGEILAHWFGWESYHSPLNQAGNTLVPSRDFSDALQLRGLPQVFHQAEPDGSPAALSYAAPPRFNGKLLYLREDLLARYAQGRTLIWFLWGERQLRPYPSPAPQWLVHAQRSDAEVWRHIARHQWSQ